MKSNPGAATVNGAPFRLTIPNDTLCSSPNGLPSASTSSPTRRRFESPSGSTVRRPAPSIFRRARSTRLSRPTTVAGNRRPSARRTWIDPALSTTWALVTISPFGSMTKPEPVLRRGSLGSSREGSSFAPAARCTRTYTSPGCRRAARSARRSLIRASSGAPEASALSRQSLGPLGVDRPEHPLANAVTATRTSNVQRRDTDIEILPAAVYDAVSFARRAGYSTASEPKTGLRTLTNGRAATRGDAASR